MISSHTPGPWRVDARKKEGTSKGYAYVLVRANGALGQVATVFENHEPNARLIAAAPDLLAALRECVRLLHNYHTGDDSDLGELAAGAEERARAAIAKVEST
jgi:hypothetical protein